MSEKPPLKPSQERTNAPLSNQQNERTIDRSIDQQCTQTTGRVSSSTTYTVAVGAGGAGSRGSNNPGANGTNSGIFVTSTGTPLISWSIGGGGGGSEVCGV